MRYLFVVLAAAYLLLIMGAVTSASEMGTAARGAQATSTPTSSAAALERSGSRSHQLLGLLSHALLARLSLERLP